MGLREAPSATLDGLKALHRAQIRKIPFENLDIHLGREIDVSRPAIFAKTIGRRRGGYCFELNELMFSALEAFGFATRWGLARVHLSGRPSGLQHQYSLAHLDGVDYLVDVGFGGQSPRAPLAVVLDAVQMADYRKYRFTLAQPFGIMLQDWWEDGWRNLYSFDGRPVFDIDRIQGNFSTSKHPTSFFTFVKSASIQTADARFSLLETRLTHETAHGVTETPIPPGEAYLEILETVFGIELDASFDDLKPLNPPP